MEMSILVLLALAVTAMAGPITVQDTDQCSDVICERSTNFRYGTGSTYSYIYKADTTTSVEGATEDTAKLTIETTADIEVLSPCEFALRLSQTRLSHSDSTGQLKAADRERTFRRAVEASELRFSFNDGVVKHVCCGNEREDPWVINFKKGVLSTFQNTMDDVTISQNVTETDVAGTCLTEYKVTNNGYYSTSVQKTKNILSCTGRIQHKTPMQTASYNVPSEIQHVPIMKTTHECEQNFQKDGILKSSTCFEKHVLRPFSHGNSGVSTTVKTTMTYKTTSYSVKTSHAAIVSKESLTFDHSADKLDSKLALAEVEHRLRDMCDNTHYDIRPESPRQFSELVTAMRSVSHSDLEDLHQLLKSNLICSDNEKTLKFFYDALPTMHTDASIKLMVSLITSNDIKGVIAMAWMTSLGFVQTPTSEMLLSVKTLIDKTKTTEGSLLPVTAMVNNYCKKMTSCDQDYAVLSIMASLERNIGFQCDASGKNFAKILLTLRAFGNAGHASRAVGLINKCLTSESNPLEIRVAAAQAFRRMPCLDEAQNEDLWTTFENGDLDSELRVSAYLALMRCPTEATLNKVATNLMKEKCDHVGAFVYSHLTNLKKTSDPHKQDVAKAAKNIFIGKEFELSTLKFSRNFEISALINKLNVGFAAESNVIWSSKSEMPRSISGNLTIDLFGQAINLMDFGARLEGLEYLVKNVFGPYMQNNKFDKTKTKADDVKGSVYGRVFGNEIFFMNSETAKCPFGPWGKMSWLDLLNKISKKQDYTSTHSAQLMDVSMSIPTVAGLPLRMDLNGTNTLNIGLKGKVDLKNLRAPPRSMDIDGEIHPSSAMEITATMSVDAMVTKTGLRMRNTLHTSTLIKGRVQLERGMIFNAEFDTPQEKMEIFSAKSKFFILHNDMEQEQNMITENRRQYKVCNKIWYTNGMEICSELSFPNASMVTGSPIFPLTGPASASITYHKRDSHTSHKLFAKRVENKKTSSVHISYSTPGSKVDRTKSIDIDIKYPEKTFDVTMKTPDTKAVIKGAGINKDRMKRLTGSMVIDDIENYSFTTEVKVENLKNKLQLTPMFEFKRVGEDGVKLTGSMSVKKPYKSLDVDLSLAGLDKQPYTLNVALLKSTKKQGLGYDIDVALKSSVVSGKLESSTFIKKNGQMSTKNVLDYTIPRFAKNKITFGGKLIDRSTKIYKKYQIKGNLGVKNNPKYNMGLDIDINHKNKHSEAEIELRYGPNPKDKTKRIVFSTSINKKLATWKKAILTYKMNVLAPAHKIDMGVLGKHLHTSKNLDSRISFNYGGKGKDVSFEVALKDKSTKLGKYNGKAVVAWPGKEYTITTALDQSSAKQFTHTLNLKSKSGVRHTITTMYNMPGAKAHEFSTEINLANSKPFTLSGSTNLDPNNMALSGKVLIGKTSYGFNTVAKFTGGLNFYGLVEVTWDGKKQISTFMDQKFGPSDIDFEFGLTSPWNHAATGKMTYTYGKYPMVGKGEISWAPNNKASYFFNYNGGPFVYDGLVEVSWDGKKHISTFFKYNRGHSVCDFEFGLKSPWNNDATGKITYSNDKYPMIGKGEIKWAPNNQASVSFNYNGGPTDYGSLIEIKWADKTVSTFFKLKKGLSDFDFEFGLASPWHNDTTGKINYSLSKYPMFGHGEISWAPKNKASYYWNYNGGPIDSDSLVEITWGGKTQISTFYKYKGEFTDFEYEFGLASPWTDDTNGKISYDLGKYPMTGKGEMSWAPNNKASYFWNYNGGPVLYDSIVEVKWADKTLVSSFFKYDGTPSDFGFEFGLTSPWNHATTGKINYNLAKYPMTGKGELKWAPKNEISYSFDYNGGPTVYDSLVEVKWAGKTQISTFFKYNHAPSDWDLEFGLTSPWSDATTGKLNYDLRKFPMSGKGELSWAPTNKVSYFWNYNGGPTVYDSLVEMSWAGKKQVSTFFKLNHAPSDWDFEFGLTSPWNHATTGKLDYDLKEFPFSGKGEITWAPNNKASYFWNYNGGPTDYHSLVEIKWADKTLISTFFKFNGKPSDWDFEFGLTSPWNHATTGKLNYNLLSFPMTGKGEISWAPNNKASYFFNYNGGPTVYDSVVEMSWGGKKQISTFFKFILRGESENDFEFGLTSPWNHAAKGKIQYNYGKYPITGKGEIEWVPNNKASISFDYNGGPTVYDSLVEVSWGGKKQISTFFKLTIGKSDNDLEFGLTSPWNHATKGKITYNHEKYPMIGKGEINWAPNNKALISFNWNGGPTVYDSLVEITWDGKTQISTFFKYNHGQSDWDFEFGLTSPWNHATKGKLIYDLKKYPMSGKGEISWAPSNKASYFWNYNVGPIVYDSLVEVKWAGKTQVSTFFKYKNAPSDWDVEFGLTSPWNHATTGKLNYDLKKYPMSGKGEISWAPNNKASYSWNYNGGPTVCDSLVEMSWAGKKQVSTFFKYNHAPSDWDFEFGLTSPWNHATTGKLDYDLRKYPMSGKGEISWAPNNKASYFWNYNGGPTDYDSLVEMSWAGKKQVSTFFKYKGAVSDWDFEFGLASPWNHATTGKLNYDLRKYPITGKGEINWAPKNKASYFWNYNGGPAVYDSLVEISWAGKTQVSTFFKYNSAPSDWDLEFGLTSPWNHATNGKIDYNLHKYPISGKGEFSWAPNNKYSYFWNYNEGPTFSDSLVEIKWAEKNLISTFYKFNGKPSDFDYKFGLTSPWNHATTGEISYNYNYGKLPMACKFEISWDPKNKAGIEANLQYDDKFKGNFRVETPFKDYSFFELSTSSMEIGHKRVSYISAEHYPRKVYRFDATYVIDMPYSFEASIRSPFPEYDNLGFAFQHSQSGSTIVSYGEVQYQPNKKIEGDLNLNWSNKYEGSLIFKTPYAGYETSKVMLTHNREKRSFSSHGEISFAEKTISVEASLNGGYRTHGSFIVKSPIPGYETVELIVNKRGNMKNSMRGDAAIVLNGKKSQANFNYRIYSKTMKSSLSVTSPYSKNFKVSMEKNGDMTSFTNKMSANYGRSYDIDSVMAFNCRGNDISANGEIKAKLAGPRKEVRVIFSQTGTDTSMDRSVDFSYECQTRTVGLSHTQKTSGSSLASTGEVFWHTGADNKVSYDLQMGKSSNYNNMINDASLKLELPSRTLELTGSLSDSKVTQNVDATFMWDSQRDTNQQVGLKAAITTSDSLHADVTVSMPSISKEIRVDGELVLNKDRIILDSKADIYYSSDSNKKLTLTTKLADISDFSAYYNYSVELVVKHPHTNIDMKMNSHIGSSDERMTVGMETSYLTARRQTKNLALLTEINKLQKQISLQMFSPDKKIEIIGDVISTSPSKLRLLNRVDDEELFRSEMTIDTGKSFEINTVSGTDKYAFVAMFPSNTAFETYVRHITPEVDHKEALFAIRLNTTRLIHSRVAVRPQMWNELTTGLQEKYVRLGYEGAETWAIMNAAVADEIEAKYQAVTYHIKEETSGYIDAMELDFTQAVINMNQISQELRNIYDNNDFYVKTVGKHYKEFQGLWEKVVTEYRRNSIDMIKPMRQGIDTMTDYPIREQYLWFVRSRMAKMAVRFYAVTSDFMEYADRVEMALRKYKEKTQQYTNSITGSMSNAANVNYITEKLSKVKNDIRRYTNTIDITRCPVVKGLLYVWERPELDMLRGNMNSAYQQSQLAYKYWNVYENLKTDNEYINNLIFEMVHDELKSASPSYQVLHSIMNPITVRTPEEEIQAELYLPFELKSLKEFPDMSPLTNRVEKYAEQVAEYKQEIWEGIKEYVTRKATTVKQVAEYITELNQERWESIKEFVTRKLPKSLEKFDSPLELVNRVEKISRQMAEYITEHNQEKWESIKEYLTQTLPKSLEKFDSPLELVNRAKKISQQVTEYITEHNQEKWESIKEYVTRTWPKTCPFKMLKKYNPFKSFGKFDNPQELVNRIQKLSQQVAEYITEHNEERWESIKESVTRMLPKTCPFAMLKKYLKQYLRGGRRVRNYWW